MMRAWKKICQVFIYLYLRLGVYSTWSRIYQILWERKRNKADIPIMPANAVLRIAKEMEYKADSVKQLWDAFSSPQAVYHLWKQGKPVGDCDEFAVFTAYALNQAPDLKEALGFEKAKILTVTWMESNGTPRGHNLVICNDLKTQEYAFVDYGKVFHKGFDPSKGWYTAREVAEAVMKRYANTEEAELLVYAVSEDDLTLLEVGIGI